MGSTIRFLRQYYRSRGFPVEEAETSYKRGGERLEATLMRPTHGRGRRSGWVVLHGLTHPGRAHPSLRRFARALAASGHVVFIPDIPEWRRLEVAPAVTVETIRSAILTLDARDEVVPGRIGLLGFSFGATQALIASVDPELDGHLAAVAAWGGYCDVHRLFRFGILGEHDLDGTVHRIAPDPYGRWIMGGNYLTGIPGYEAMSDVAEALHTLAREAGRSGVGAWEDRFDPMKRELREGLDPRERSVFDKFAPPAGTPPWDRDEAWELSGRLADAALRADPLLDPGPFLPRVSATTLLAHGRDDRLVPFTELYRLKRALPGHLVGHAAVTALFAHSGGAAPELGLVGKGREAVRFLRLLRAILGLV